MCMWQSHAPSGALSFGGSVPTEFDTGWPWLCRPIADAVAAIATIEAFLMNVRRAVMSISPFSQRMEHPGPDRQGRRSRARRNRISFPRKEQTMKKTVISHAAFGCATALLASCVTYLALAQTQPPANTGTRQTELFRTTMNDVLGRVVTIRRTERDPGNGSSVQPVRYLVIQISDPTKPQTVPE